METERVNRKQILSFIGLTLKSLIQILSLSLFKPKNLHDLSSAFATLYSKLWDFAEHSISQEGFNLPSAMGDTPVHRTNKLLSEIYGAKFSSLSFGGSSGALLTLLTAVLPRLHPDRDLVLFDDVCHQSTIGGLIFGRWKAVRLTRNKHPRHKTVYPVTFKSVKKIIEYHGPDNFAAIILVLPSYDGFRSPTEDKKIYTYAKAHGITVIVDGAWDALSFRNQTEQIPVASEISDVWITSPHKRGLTPSSLGCMLTENESIARLWDDALDLGFRSSSISFVECMIAEHRLSQIASGLWNLPFEKAEQAATLLRHRLKDIHPDIYSVHPDQVQAETNDPCHILISVDKIPNLDARKWAKILSTDFAIDVEKATRSTLLLLCGSPEHLNQIDLIISHLKQSLNIALTQTSEPSI